MTLAILSPEGQMSGAWPMAYAAAMSTSEPQADRPKTTRPGRKRDRTSAAAPTLRLTLRLDVGGRPTLGPGKARLLELIGETGSISAAGRAMGMSYRRAWMLADSLNASFAAPLIAARPGGAGGGGAALLPFGAEVVRLYRALEQRAAGGGVTELERLHAMLATSPP